MRRRRSDGFLARPTKPLALARGSMGDCDGKTRISAHFSLTANEWNSLLKAVHRGAAWDAAETFLEQFHVHSQIADERSRYGDQKKMGDD